MQIVSFFVAGGAGPESPEQNRDAQPADREEMANLLQSQKREPWDSVQQSKHLCNQSINDSLTVFFLKLKTGKRK